MNEVEQPYRITITHNGDQVHTNPPPRKGRRNVTRKNLEVTVTQASEYVARQGNAAWEEIHTYFGNCHQYFSLWRRTMIPKNCSCAEDFTAILDQYPPDFSSPENFGVWTWFIHNIVNQKLNKQFFTIEDYCEKYNRPLDVYLPLSKKYTSLPVLIDQPNHAD